MPPRSNILFASFPRELLKNDMVYDPIMKQDIFIWENDFGKLSEYVSQFSAGTWPDISSSLATPELGTSSCE